MRVTFPHMGTLHLTLSTLFKQLGAEVIDPPLTTQKTLALGLQHSPEFACLPLKLMVGNFIQAVEKGADTIVMCGGCGPCRLGHYAQVQQGILHDLGYKARLVVLEADLADLIGKIHQLAPGRSWREIFYAVKTAWNKMQAIDEFTALANYLRPRVLKPRSVSDIYEQGLQLFASVHTGTTVCAAHQQNMQALQGLPRRTVRPLLRVGIVGELFVVLEPLVNQDIERHLGELGVEVERTICISQWVRSHLAWNREARKQRAAVAAVAKPYLGHWVGGHGLESVGHTIRLAQASCDGVIQLFPFTCMPEIVAKSILPRVSEDYAIPVMTLVLDEHTGKAGIMTRLEAFVDLLARRQKQGDKAHECISGS